MNDNGVSIELLKEWLKVLEDAVYKMRVDQHVFRSVFDIIEKSDELQKRPSHFYAWMYDNYVERMAMGIRRLRDTRPKTISITTFLRRIKGDPTVISRKYYFTHFPPDFLRVSMLPKEQNDLLRTRTINREYDRLVGGEGLAQPTAELLDSEIAWLDMFGEPVVTYATKVIAHHDEKPPQAFPTLDDVDTFIDYAEELVKKYIVLVNGVSQEFGVHFQYDWLAPLRVTWLPQAEWFRLLKERQDAVDSAGTAVASDS